ncbi:MAG: flagellar basal body P-ring formation protein FlgA [Alphaproteobacteria bacterium]|nr:flagellar basal body P-ring formation protein FlgA [Alphaproteobacteria bacterium]
MNSRICIALLTSFFAAPSLAGDWLPAAQYGASKQQVAALAPLPNQPTYFNITMKDVEKKVAEAMVGEGVAEYVETNVLPSGTPILFKANHPIELVVHALQIDPDAKRWQAEAYIIADGKTEAVKPIAGRYDELMRVPMLTRQMGMKDVITLDDMEMRLVASRKLRKDTVTDVDQMIGKSARRLISAGRMIRQSELTTAIAVERDRSVEMVYRTPTMSIRTMGKALENGAAGDLIRVMNQDTQRTISAKVIDSSRVEVAPMSAIN